jgi:hypothetical protein
VKAIAEAGSVTLSWDHALNGDQNHAKAAQALANKYKWRGRWFMGGFDGGYAFVQSTQGVPDFITMGDEPSDTA